MDNKFAFVIIGIVLLSMIWAISALHEAAPSIKPMVEIEVSPILELCTPDGKCEIVNTGGVV